LVSWGGRGLGVSLVVSAVCCCLATQALAGGVQIRRVDTRGYPTVKVLVLAPSLTEAAPTLSQDSAPVVGLVAENLANQESVVLVIDHSQSMHGRALADAVQAARDFVTAKPAADQIGVITVSSQAQTLADFSSDGSSAAAALQGLAIDTRYGTVLWDAIRTAADTLRAHGLLGRTIILVTDGQETTSKTTLREAVQAAQAAHAAIYTVGVRDSTYTPLPLQQLAAATGGRFYPALRTAQLPSIYAAISAELRRSWLLSYATAARPGDTLKLEVESAGTRATTTTTLSHQLANPDKASSSETLLTLTLILTAGLLLAGLTFAYRNLRLPRLHTDDF